MSSLFKYLVRGKDDAWSTAYGPFVLRTALQPIFRQPRPDLFELVALQGLARAERNGEAFSPAQFFSLVPTADRPLVDELLRTIHILNAGCENYEKTLVFVNVDPRLYPDMETLRHTLEHIRLAAHEAGIDVSRIVCEIPLSAAVPESRAIALARHLRDSELQLAISEYGAGDGDLERVRLFRPRFARFDSAWVRDFMHNPAGMALLKVIVRQFIEEGCSPLFDRLEEEWHIELCTQIGVPYLQGYGLAEPRLAPGGFRRDFPPMLEPVAEWEQPNETSERSSAESDRPEAHSSRRRPTFGKRHP